MIINYLAYFEVLYIPPPKSTLIRRAVTTTGDSGNSALRVFGIGS